MEENTNQFVDRLNKLGEGEFREGAKITPNEIPADYVPPSASMNPAASAMPTEPKPTDDSSAD
jgi:hypothetical protein